MALSVPSSYTATNFRTVTITLPNGPVVVSGGACGTCAISNSLVYQSGTNAFYGCEARFWGFRV